MHTVVNASGMQTAGWRRSLASYQQSHELKRSVLSSANRGLRGGQWGLSLLGESGPVLIDAGVLLDAKIDRLLLFAGLDIYELRCRLALGDVLSPPQSVFEHGYALRFLYAQETGKLRLREEGTHLHDGPPSSRATVEWERATGEMVRPPKSVSDTVGWLIVEADDRFSAWHLAESMQPSDLFSVEGGQ